MTAVDPATGMTIGIPGAGAGDSAWRAALEEKARMFKTINQNRTTHGRR
jgi:hypothetical protein